MQWHSETFGDWQERLSKWHKWFAWHPVFMYRERRTVWLETVYRRLTVYHSYAGDCNWIYRSSNVNDNS